MGRKANSKIVYQQLIKDIVIDESRDEIRAIAMLLLNSLGVTRNDILSEKEFELDSQKLAEAVKRINLAEPIQYVLGEAYFLGRSFLVNQSVLIPRPETELLVQLILEENKTKCAVLDIGTGSGCIAISLALDLKSSRVHALDFSKAALEVAKKNAARLNAHITFHHLDILKDLPALTDLDIIVSNPPYVMDNERKNMTQNVLSYEPHSALFVPDENPLIFYEVLAKIGKEVLKPKGKFFVEINAQLGKEVVDCFAKNDYSEIEIIKDLDGKGRIVCGSNRHNKY